MCLCNYIFNESDHFLLYFILIFTMKKIFIMETEKSLEKAKEEMIAFFNIAAIKKWIANGEPFEEHDEVLAYKKYHGITESKFTNFIF